MFGNLQGINLGGLMASLFDYKNDTLQTKNVTNNLRTKQKINS